VLPQAASSTRDLAQVEAAVRAAVAQRKERAEYILIG
jgi:hypothetical protein